MGALVAVQVPRAHEALPTVLADMRLLSRVNAIVPGHGAAMRVALPTVLADVRLLPRMNTPVLGQMAALRVAIPTVLADVRLLSCVNTLVCDQVGWGPESFAAPRVAARVLLFANGSLHRVR